VLLGREGPGLNKILVRVIQAAGKAHLLGEGKGSRTFPWFANLGTIPKGRKNPLERAAREEKKVFF